MRFRPMRGHLIDSFHGHSAAGVRRSLGHSLIAWAFGGLGAHPSRLFNASTLIERRYNAFINENCSGDTPATHASPGEMSIYHYKNCIWITTEYL
jgi:hypothetical protein